MLKVPRAFSDPGHAHCLHQDILKKIIGGLYLPIRLRLVHSRFLMHNHVPGDQFMHYSGQKFDALVTHQFNWATKPGDDVLIDESGHIAGFLGREGFCYDPFCTVIGGNHHIGIAGRVSWWLKRADEIQSPLLKWFEW